MKKNVSLTRRKNIFKKKQVFIVYFRINLDRSIFSIPITNPVFNILTHLINSPKLDLGHEPVLCFSNFFVHEICLISRSTKRMHWLNLDWITSPTGKKPNESLTTYKCNWAYRTFCHLLMGLVSELLLLLSIKLSEKYKNFANLPLLSVGNSQNKLIIGNFSIPKTKKKQIRFIR